LNPVPEEVVLYVELIERLPNRADPPVWASSIFVVWDAAIVTEKVA
jgi:hypothetical protein